jgi:CRP-like cAMP-binding protein
MDHLLTQILEQHEVFSHINQLDRERLFNLGIIRKYKAGEKIARAGDIWPYIFLILDGCVRAVKESVEGRMLVAVELSKGDLFWGLAFFHEKRENPVTFAVPEPTIILIWEKEKILPFLQSDGRLCWELNRIMVLRMLQASEVIEGLAFQPVAGRLARLLVEYPGKASSGPTARSLTLDEMAARIGSTREMVCRFLQRFADDGLIKITRTEFEVMDGGKLMEMAQKVKP